MLPTNQPPPPLPPKPRDLRQRFHLLLQRSSSKETGDTTKGQEQNKPIRPKQSDMEDPILTNGDVTGTSEQDTEMCHKEIQVPDIVNGEINCSRQFIDIAIQTDCVDYSEDHQQVSSGSDRDSDPDPKPGDGEVLLRNIQRVDAELRKSREVLSKEEESDSDGSTDTEEAATKSPEPEVKTPEVCIPIEVCLLKCKSGVRLNDLFTLSIPK